jgi:hypothetical protein
MKTNKRPQGRLFQNVDKLHIYQRYAGSDNFIVNELNGFRN